MSGKMDCVMCREESRQYECEGCHKRFSSPLLLKLHEKRHSQLTLVYLCGLCGKRFTTEGLCLLHQSLHRDPDACVNLVEGKVEINDNVVEIQPPEIPNSTTTTTTSTHTTTGSDTAKIPDPASVLETTATTSDSAAVSKAATAKTKTSASDTDADTAENSKETCDVAVQTQGIFGQVKTEMYSCAKCQISYNSFTLYMTHLACHSEAGEFVCSACGVHFKSVVDFNLHIMNQTHF